MFSSPSSSSLLILTHRNPRLFSLARHLVSLYHAEAHETQTNRATISQSFLKSYISYCRSAACPEMDEEAVEELIAGYLGMRSMGSNRGMKTISATPRMLESLIRISQVTGDGCRVV